MTRHPLDQLQPRGKPPTTVRAIETLEARAHEAAVTGEIAARAWPPVVTAHPRWEADYHTYATGVGVAVSLVQAVDQLNDWIAAISA